MSVQTKADPQSSGAAAAVDLKLEVVPIPVADVERAKSFYAGIGWRLDAEFSNKSDWHLIQMTPPGSACSVMFGKGFTTVAPGSLQGAFLVVDNIETARANLVAKGVEVSEIFHFENNLLRVAPGKGRLPGLDPKRGSYFSFATFSDPDGNSWLLQEISTRFPGRGVSSADVATLREFLHEAETRHGKYEATAPKHHWADWYAPYIVARERGKAADEAASEATVHADQVIAASK